MFSLARKVRRQLSSREFDILVLRLDVLPLAPQVIVRRHRTPYALKTLSQASILALEQRPVLHRLLFSRLNVELFRSLVSGAAMTDVCSQAMIRFFAERLTLPEDRFVWIDNAVDTSRFVPTAVAPAREQIGLTDFNPIVGYVGQRPWERGARQLVEIAPRLLAEYPRLGVLVVGGGPDLTSLVKLAEDLGVSDRCVIVGQVPFDSVPLYCNALDVGVSINVHSDRFAAAELKVRQYLACGKPVVASGGSNDFLVSHQLGTIVDPSDSFQVERAVRQWLTTSSEERRDFAARARRFVHEHLSYAAAVQRRLALWSELLGSENHRAR